MASLSDNAQIIVAEDEGTVIGAVAYCPPGSTPLAEFFEPEWPINRMLVVDRAARRMGVGRKLTDECMHRAKRDRLSSACTQAR